MCIYSRHIPGCQKNGAFHIGIQKNRVVHILSVEKGGPIIYLAALKRGPFGMHICTMPYIGSYTPQNAASDQGLHCLLRPVCWKTLGI